MDTARSRTPLIIAIIAGIACLGLTLVVVAAAVGVSMFIVRGSDDRATEEPTARTTGTDPSPTEPGPSADPDPSPSATSPPATTTPPPAEDIVLPPGVEEEQAYLELSTSTDGPVVDVYIDFMCPPCKTFYETNRDDLIEFALLSEATVRVHPRPMLDADSSPPGHSGRAANASVCAYADKPEYWFPAADALFAAQPEDEAPDDETLIELVTEETGADVADCIEDGTYVPWLEQVVETEALDTTPGTPTVMIDGEIFDGFLFQAGALRAAVESA